MSFKSPIFGSFYGKFFSKILAQLQTTSHGFLILLQNQKNPKSLLVEFLTCSNKM